MIIESQYFPPISVLAAFKRRGKVIIDTGDFFRKGSFRNKCYINASQGPLLLSVPLQKGKNNLQPFSDVRISYDEDWVSQHLSSLQTCYGKSAYFIYFFDEITALLKERPVYLLDLNRNILKMIATYLIPEVTIIYSDSYVDEYLGEDKRNQILLKNYTLFESPRYLQVFEDRTGFVPNLSCLDLLFCLGKYGHDIL
ncbi:MAG: WbqC family protein [Saprospiraceae bacterium]|jgi:hypothetical protein|nr:WbqC family protein [Candidatus Parvibacillus calidus]MBX2936273.1 WbqC family protein [Saprospiraceae bacterium]MBX7180043.1 WbqC family protein [Saprospiraceae bacterium]MCB0590027.1 WbqC family protein [Saprospiraceae bacterium]MCO5283232.1 WbqC family protein [Saprospiraceae bacterium]